jgi:hypothetical protein
MFMKKLFLLIIFIFTINGGSLYALPKPEYDLYTHITAKAGLFFDNPDEINSAISALGYPEIKSDIAPYIGINYAANHFPFLFYSIPNIFFSLDVRFPLERKSTNILATELKTTSLFIELVGFHDLINNITVYPIMGFGFSWTNLDLYDTIPNPKIVDITNGSAKRTRFSKFNALLNLGGGMDYKINIVQDYMKKVNLIVGLNIRYSLNLDVLGLYDKSWTSAGKDVSGLPDYHAPGLSIEMKVGVEYLQKTPKTN